MTESYGADALDAEWRRLAETGNREAYNLEAQLQHYAEMYEQKLAELRELAQKSAWRQKAVSSPASESSRHLASSVASVAETLAELRDLARMEICNERIRNLHQNH